MDYAQFKKPSQLAGLFSYRSVIPPSPPKTFLCKLSWGPRPTGQGGEQVSISSRKLKNPERESVRDFFVLHGVTVQNFNQNLRNIILRIYLHKLVNDIDADDIISQR